MILQYLTYVLIALGALALLALVFGENLIDWFSNAEDRIAAGVQSTNIAPLK